MLQAGLLVRRTVGKHHFTSVDHALLASLFAELPIRLGEPHSKQILSHLPTKEK